MLCRGHLLWTPFTYCVWSPLCFLQQLHTLEKDLVSACDLLGVGAEYARVVGSEYTRSADRYDNPLKDDTFLHFVNILKYLFFTFYSLCFWYSLQSPVLIEQRNGKIYKMCFHSMVIHIQNVWKCI